MSALARSMSINPSTVSRWEDGSSVPDLDTLASLASHLNVRPEFFYRPVFESARPTFLRSLSSTLVRDLQYQSAQMRWLQEISHAVEHYVDLPTVNIPDVMDGASYHQLRDEDIEKIALELRRHWGLGEGPCGDMVALLERFGFVVSVIEMGTVKLDGLCSWSPADDRPHILLASDKMSFARRQMDAAHEMAHAILHRHVTEEQLKRDLKLIETQAFRLASAFLLPSTTFPVEMQFPSLAAMVTAKERWRVAIKAQIKRLADLDVIPKDFATHLYKLYSAKGWTKEEPFDRQWAPGEPRILRDALHLIVDESVRSKADLLALEFSVSAGDIENLTGLPHGWFMREAATVVRLKSGSHEPTAESGKGEVISFPKPR
ncbi:XRE family transcriptional regulator [Thalassospiraceae bacterium LMO-SO8]|nr:XRE family transcriptional regulator [Alphaproteobacteria bacterium LMO-S08]WND76261.1 XRE family transcriptional regulator [Thalassospiraceae bacterium LMO-SO8]